VDGDTLVDTLPRRVPTRAGRIRTIGQLAPRLTPTDLQFVYLHVCWRWWALRWLP